MLIRLGSALYRARWAVIAAAVALLAGAAVFDPGLFGALKSGGFDVPGSASVRGQMLLDARLGGETPDIVVLMSDGQHSAVSPAFRAAALHMLARVRARSEVTAVVSYYSTQSARFLSHDGRMTFALVQLAAHDETARENAYLKIAHLLTSPTLRVALGGRVPLSVELDKQIEADLVRAETFTFPIVAVLLVVVFGGVVAAGLPLLVGAAAILGAFAILRLLTGVTDISVFATNLVSMIGLGLAIDYALFMVTRFREEMALDARDVRGALGRTMATAGHTVFFSGLMVGTSLLGLLLFPEGFLHSMGLGAIAAVAVALGSALLVLPALLAVLGPRVNALSLRGRRSAAQGGAVGLQGAWYRLSELVMRHPVAVLLLVAGLLVVVGSPVVRASFSTIDVRALPPDRSARVVAERLARDFSAQDNAQAVIAVHTPGSALDPDNLARLDTYVRAIRRLPGVVQVDSLVSVDPTLTLAAYQYTYRYALGTPQVVAAAAQFARGDTTKIVVSMQPLSLSPDAERLVRQIRGIVPPAGLAPLVTGDTARQIDLFDDLRARIPPALLIIAVMVGLLFFVLTGSLVMPLKAIVLNALSLSATFGALVWIFQEGHLQRWLGFTATGSLDGTQPILIFAMAFGLSMDYEVFLLSRIKEQFDATGSNRAAIAMGVQRTGWLISSAALLLAIVVGAFVTSEIVVMKEVGVGLAIGVLVDATLVRALLVPATMRLLGRWNWWAPTPLRALARGVGLHNRGLAFVERVGGSSSQNGLLQSAFPCATVSFDDDKVQRPVNGFSSQAPAPAARSMASPITVYTGGTCYPNQDPGPGAWAYVSIIDGQECEASGAHSATTAMRMHLTAAIKGLEAAERGRTVLMYTSSQVVQHGMMEWIHKWQRNGWRTSNGQPVDNQDLWERLYSLASGRTVQWEWLCDDMDRTAGTDKQTQRVHALACGALQGVAAGVVADQADDGEAEAVSGEPEAVDEPLDNREAIVVKEQRDCVGAEEARQLSGDDEQLAFSAECQALQLRWTHLHEEVVLLDQEWQRVLDAVNRCQEAKRNGQPLDWTAGAFMFARLGRHAGRMANIAAEARQTCEQYAKALQRAMEGIPEG